MDPTGRHELRWHDGDRFTGYVSDDGRQAIDSLDPTADEAVGNHFDNAARARRRLVTALIAIAIGIALAFATIVGDATGPVVVLFGSPIVWGCAQAVRSWRFIRRAHRSPNIAAPNPPPPVTFDDQVRVIDDLLERGRISPTSHATARLKLVRRYNVNVEGGAPEG